MHLIFDWLLYSSKDPNKYSLTVKGLLTGAVAYAVTVSGIVHVVLPVDQLTTLVDLTGQFVQWGLTGVSLVATIYGAVYKIYTTVAGKNAVVAAYSAKG